VTRQDAVLRALGTVRDPELDEAITSLGFVASCTVSAAGDCEVRLRLPTYFCAPNFAYLMVADAYDAAAAVPGVRNVQVLLDDHFASRAINSGVAAHAGFVRSFGGEAEAELDELRADFLRKAVLAGTDRLCRELLAAGWRAADLPGTTLGQVPPTAAAEALRSRRCELGLPCGDAAPLLIDVRTGRGIPADEAPLWLRRARVTAVSVEANASICSGMLRHRYQEG
jgi:metal-sulfur cluster biosynthetic enzyme